MDPSSIKMDWFFIIFSSSLGHSLAVELVLFHNYLTVALDRDEKMALPCFLCIDISRFSTEHFNSHDESYPA